MNKTSPANINHININLDVSFLTPIPRNSGPFRRPGDEATVQPKEALVSLFPGTDEEPDVTITGYIIRADGERDRRYSYMVTVLGAWELETKVAELAISLLKEATPTL